MEDNKMVGVSVVWKEGKRISSFPVGPDGWRVVATEHFTLVDRKLVPGAVTLRLERGLGR